MTKAAMTATHRATESLRDNPWNTSKNVARQAAGTFLGGHSNEYMDQKKVYKKKKK
jgi:hypothetical protein